MLAPLYSESAIADRVQDIADKLNAQYKEAELVHIVVTLSGAFIFAADLIRLLNFPIIVSFSGLAPYAGEDAPQSNLRVNADEIPPSFGNQPVVIIEDIVDSGKTVAKLRQLVADRMAASIEVVALLKRQASDAKADYFGFTVPKNLFIVGYGLDLDGRYRELKEIKTVGVMPNTETRAMC
jgi:hypoxanthine phosphoribosyltransferase